MALVLNRIQIMKYSRTIEFPLHRGEKTYFAHEGYETKALNYFHSPAIARLRVLHCTSHGLTLQLTLPPVTHCRKILRPRLQKRDILYEHYERFQ